MLERWPPWGKQDQIMLNCPMGWDIESPFCAEEVANIVFNYHSIEEQEFSAPNSPAPHTHTQERARAHSFLQRKWNAFTVVVCLFLESVFNVIILSILEATPLYCQILWNCLGNLCLKGTPLCCRHAQPLAEGQCQAISTSQPRSQSRLADSRWDSAHV